MQQGERKGHSFQNGLHALAFFLSLKFCLQQLHTQLHTPPLNAGEEGWPKERQKWSKPWKENESRPLPYNQPAAVTATITTLSKKKDPPTPAVCPIPWVFEEEESYGVMLMTETMRGEGVWKTHYTTEMEKKEKPRLRKELCHQNLL